MAAAIINQPSSFVSNMLYSSLLSRNSYASYAAAEAGPSTSTAGRRLASPLRAVAPWAWPSDDSEDEDTVDDDEEDYRGRSSYRRPVPFALPTNPTPVARAKTVLPDAAVKSPNATYSPIAIPPSPLQLPTTTGPLFPDRPTDAFFSIRTLSVDSARDDALHHRAASPSPISLGAAAPSSACRASSIASDTSGSGSSTDWDDFSDYDDDDDDDGLDSPALLASDETVVIRRNSDDADYLVHGLSFARKPSLTTASPPAYSLSLPSSLQPDLKELAFLSSSARSRSFRLDPSPQWTA